MVTFVVHSNSSYKNDAIYREYPSVPRHRVSRGPSTLLIVLRRINHWHASYKSDTDPEKKAKNAKVAYVAVAALDCAVVLT